jgi:hypothetical protein
VPRYYTKSQDGGYKIVIRGRHIGRRATLQEAKALVAETLAKLGGAQ